MQLREAEPIGAIDDDRVRARHVDARFDDRRTDEHVEALPVEIEHHLLELALGHLAVRDAKARFGEQLAELARGLFDRVDFVMQEIHLTATRELALERLADQRRIVDADECLHRKPMRGRRRDDRKIAQARHRHVQRARNRRRGERQEIDFGAKLLQLLLLAHAEALFLVDDDEAEILEPHIGLQQLVRADHDVDLAVGKFLQRFLGFLLRLEARKHVHAHGPVGEAIAEVLVVLLREQRRRHEHGDLLASRRGDERGAQRHFGLAEADVAADDAVHRLALGEIVDDGFDRLLLVRRFLERERRGELLGHCTIDRQRDALPRFALRVDRKQFRGDIAHFLRGLLLRALPRVAAERVQRRELGRSARVAADEMELRYRHVELVALGVFDR